MLPRILPSHRMQRLAIGLLLPFVILGVKNTYAQEESIKLPSGFPGVEAQDVQISNYDNEAEIKRWADPQENKSEFADDLDRIQQIIPSARGIETLPETVDQFMLDRPFEVSTFEYVVARLKTAARQFFYADSMQASLRRASTELDSETISEYTPDVQFNQYLTSRSGGSFKWIDPDSDDARERAWAQIVDGYGLQTKEDSSGNKVVLIGANISGQKPVKLGDYEKVSREWYAKEPLTVYPLHLRVYDGLAIGSRIVVPLVRDGEVYGLAEFNPYNGEMKSYGTFARSYEALAKPDSHPKHEVHPMKKYPIMNRSKAKKVVAKKTKSNPKKSIFVSLNGNSEIPMPAVLTENGEVYFVGPMTEEVW